ncbi:MAG: hypothetical protein R3F17_12340 [Planctomycetota bacterium]
MPGHKRLDEDVQPGDVDFAVFQGRSRARPHPRRSPAPRASTRIGRFSSIYLVEPARGYAASWLLVDRYPREWDTEPCHTPRYPPSSPARRLRGDDSHLDDHVAGCSRSSMPPGWYENTRSSLSDNGPLTHDVGGVDTGFFDSSGGPRAQGQRIRRRLRVLCGALARQSTSAARSAT